MKTGNQSRRHISIGSMHKNGTHTTRELKKRANIKPNIITKGYFKSENKCCVVCGRVNELTLHHVVPFHFRVYFPLITNGILRKIDEHDILPFCRKCHLAYDKEGKKFANEIYALHGIITNNKLQKQFDKIRSCLVNNRKGLSSPNTTPERQEEYKQKMIDCIDHFFIGGVNQDDMALFGGKVPNMGQYRSYRVMMKYRFLTDLQKFVECWRNHFLKYMEPRFLPIGWNAKRSILAEMTVPAKKKRIN